MRKLKNVFSNLCCLRYALVLMFVVLAITSCKKDELVPEDQKPEWLGASIYEELANPQHLEGTFNTYLKLVDDLDYGTTLAQTGSKTIFPANDEAFERFFKSNSWGVGSYEQLTIAQKKMLLYSSMLDNAMLLGMLPNISSGNAEEPLMKGMAVKHASNVSVIDSISLVKTVPANNTYWSKLEGKPIYAVYDNTKPMMVHFTREQMLTNNITTLGEASDFAVITGSPYTEGTAFVFDKQVIRGDVTCQNGYIHQLNDVLVPPGNMAQVLRAGNDTKYMSRILDYFSAPFYDATTTNNYNEWARQNNVATIDSIYQVRYMSVRSQGASLNRDPNGQIHSNSELLAYDPGWNEYYPAVSSTNAADYSITDMGAAFVPTDDAFWNYFNPQGFGGYIIDIYKDYPNTRENFGLNLDALHRKKPQVLTTFVNNLFKPSFVATVPSKFESITNDANENMGVNMNYLVKKDGKYDVKIANNGVIYMMNEMIAPDEYQSVLAPASLYDDMKIMNAFVQDRSVNGTPSVLGADMYFYLMAMNANYAFSIPDDKAFESCYINPASLGHTNPEALKFYYDETATGTVKVSFETYRFNPETGEIGELSGIRKAVTTAKTQIQDLLNYHTVVLDSGVVFGKNHYYVTKHGGAVKFDVVNGDSLMYGGMQIDNKIAPSKITQTSPEKNGLAFRLDRIIQPTVNSVYKWLTDNSQFKDFMDICDGFGDSDLLDWAGISSAQDPTTKTSEQDRYIVFTNTINKVAGACLDYNVKFLSAYNYTLYAPNNTAMQKAFDRGLPTWEQIEALFAPYREKPSENPSDEELAAKAQALSMISTLRNFVRYHFQNNSIFADNDIEGGEYQSLLSNDLGIAQRISVSGGNGTLKIQDIAGKKTGTVYSIKEQGTTLTNKFARDYTFNADLKSATDIVSSSFTVIHEISDPLNFNASGRYDGDWSRAKTAKSHNRKTVKPYNRK